MRPIDAAPTFQKDIVFPDVDAATLAREDGMIVHSRVVMSGTGAWGDYLRKVLAPTNRPPRANLRMLSAQQV